MQEKQKDVHDLHSGEEDKDSVISHLQNQIETLHNLQNTSQDKLSEGIFKVEEQLNIPISENSEDQDLDLFDRILRVGSNVKSLHLQISDQICDILDRGFHDIKFLQDTLYNIRDKLGGTAIIPTSDIETQEKLQYIRKVAFDNKTETGKLQEALHQSIMIHQDDESKIKYYQGRISDLEQQINFYIESGQNPGNEPYLDIGLHEEQIDNYALENCVRQKVELEYNDKLSQLNTQLSDAQSKAEIDNKEIQVLRQKYANLEKKYKELIAKYKELAASQKAAITDANLSKQKLQAELDIAKSTNESQAKELNDIRDKSTKTETDLTKYKKVYALLKKKYDQVDQKNKELKEQIKNMREILGLPPETEGEEGSVENPEVEFVNKINEVNKENTALKEQVKEISELNAAIEEKDRELLNQQGKMIEKEKRETSIYKNHIRFLEERLFKYEKVQIFDINDTSTHQRPEGKPDDDDSDSESEGKKTKEGNQNVFIGEDDEEHHKILKKIGEGATSIAYKIIDDRTSEVMCKKVVKSVEDEEAFNKLRNSLREFGALTSISHPSVCRAIGMNTSEKVEENTSNKDSDYDYDDDDDDEKAKKSREKEKTTIALFLEYLPFKLKDVLKSDIMNDTLRVKICIEVAFGMKHLHQSGMIHRDLNSILEAKIIDFDLVHIEDGGSKTKGVGTLDYMSPEMLNNEKYDNKTDVYSYGIVVFVLLTGHLPKQNMTDKMTKKPIKFPRHSSSITPEGIELINKCTAFEPKDRPSFSEILEIIENKKFKLAKEVDTDIVLSRYQELNRFESEYQKKEIKKPKE